ncbi:hypothetical protein M1N79_03670 [Dehalococcoidia bacterium]|nr:hypothetical protein [Dehalococcoidia bacterium]
MNALGAKLRRGGGFGGDVGLAEATTLCVVVFHSIPHNDQAHLPLWSATE